MDNFHDFVDVKYCSHFLQDPAFCSFTVTDTVLSARFPGSLSDVWTVMTDAEVPSGAPREVRSVWGAELPLGGAAGLVRGISLPGPALLAPPAGSHQGQACWAVFAWAALRGGRSTPGLAGSPATVGRRPPTAPHSVWN